MPDPAVIASPDPELEQLPKPRHPWRKATIGSLLLCFVLSLTLAVGLLGDLVFSLRGGPPRALGDLARLGATQANQWVKAEGELAEHGGIKYQRPFESDSFRLVPVAGNPKVWVQVRVPAGFEDEHFVPPTDFVGRLLSSEHLGIRYSALKDALVDAGWPAGHMPGGALILVDGESPTTVRWVDALMAVLLAFAAFSLWAATSVLRPARSG